MGRNWPDGGYSADVDAWFQWDHAKYPIAQVGPDRFVVKDSIPPVGIEGKIVITVDGRESIYPARTVRVEGKEVFYEKMEGIDGK